MKRYFSITVFILSAALTLRGQDEKKLVIVHTNDLHSRLAGYAPESTYSPLERGNDKTTGGFARIAGIIKEEKLKNPGSTLVVDAGDFMMGTLFPALEEETGFQLRLMKMMGYDVLAMGNHEFDFGPGWISGVIRKSASEGEIPVILSGNSVFSTPKTRCDEFESLFRDKLVSRTLITERNGIKIGLFSVLGSNAASVAPRSRPVSFGDKIKASEKLVKELQEAGCTVIICLSHSGVTKEKNGEWGGEDEELAKRVKGLSLIVGGHSHTRLDKPMVINGVPIVQTGEFGRNVGEFTLTVKNGRVSTDSYRLIPVDDNVIADETTDSMINAQKERISSSVLLPLGLTYSGVVAETDFVVEGNDTGDFMNSNLGPMVADAIHYLVNKESTEGSDISMVAAGMLFDRIVPGIQTAPDLFRVMPLGSGSDKIPGYPLARLWVTGRELKNILEILQVAYRKSPDNYCYYSGVKVVYDPEKGLLKKIKSIEIIRRDGSVVNVDFNKKNKTLYSITANSYMLEFIGIIKKTTMGLVNVVPKNSKGEPVTDMKTAVIDIDPGKAGTQEGKEWLAIIRYLSSMKDTNGNGIPDIDSRYSAPVRTFFRTASGQ